LLAGAVALASCILLIALLGSHLLIYAIVSFGAGLIVSMWLAISAVPTANRRPFVLAGAVLTVIEVVLTGVFAVALGRLMS